MSANNTNEKKRVIIKKTLNDKPLNDKSKIIKQINDDNNDNQIVRKDQLICPIVNETKQNKKIIKQINDNDNASFYETNENPIDNDFSSNKKLFNNDQSNSTLFNDTNKKIIKIQKCHEENNIDSLSQYIISRSNNYDDNIMHFSHLRESEYENSGEDDDDSYGDDSYEDVFDEEYINNNKNEKKYISR